MPEKIISIQVIPIIETIYRDRVTKVETQPNGPTEETTGWAIYKRSESRLLSWVANTNGELNADIVGLALANYYQVEVEPCSWKKNFTNQS